MTVYGEVNNNIWVGRIERLFEGNDLKKKRLRRKRQGGVKQLTGEIETSVLVQACENLLCILSPNSRISDIELAA